MRSETRGPGRRVARRFTFLALLLVAVAAPAGFVLAGEQARPYVVVFNDSAVASAAEPAQTMLRHARQDESRAPDARRVDSKKVLRHIVEIQARNRVRAENVYANAVGGFSAMLNEKQVRALQRDPLVAAVMPDEEIALDEGPADLAGSGIRTTMNPDVGVPAGIRRVGALRSTNAGIDGRERRVNADVAIIDTGIQRNHPDLNVVGGYNCTSRKRDKWDDDDGHGTHVAGIVGALDNRVGVVGVAPGARLWAVKVLDGRGRGSLSWMVCGIDWVTAQRENGNQSRALFEVANMSISLGLSGHDTDCGRASNDWLHQAICRSVSKGTVYVAAAGNESRNARRNRPAAYDEVITVSAMADYDGRGGGKGVPSDSCPYWTPERDDSFASFSNYGADVDLIAPGRCILSTYPQGRYGWMSGTSMAAPHVSGAAAVYRAMYPGATPQQVRMALQAVGTSDWRTSTDPDNAPEKALWIGQFRTVPDFSLAAQSNSSAPARPGGTTSITVSLTRIGGFDQVVDVALLDPAAGFSAAPVATGGGSIVLDVAVASGVRAGRYTLTVRASADGIERTASVNVTVQGGPPVASFTSPAQVQSFDSTGVVTVAWSDEAGAAAVRPLTRQSGRIKTPGTCEGVRWATNYTRSRTSPVADRTTNGFCYRWSVAMSDAAGHRTNILSGAVLVDTTAPRAPSVGLAEPGRTAFDLTELGVDAAYVGLAGTLWVRGNANGSVELEVSGYDAESGVMGNTAVVDTRAGWRASWVGDPAAGLLRVSFTSQARESAIEVRTINGAGLTGDSSVGHLIPDSTVPTAAQWTSIPEDAVFPTAETAAVLRWTSGEDAGSGLADAHWVVRYSAPVNDKGTCRTSEFVLDGAPQLRSNGTTDDGLQPGYCYAWGVRALDNVGNAAPVAWSGWVIVEGTRR